MTDLESFCKKVEIERFALNKILAKRNERVAMIPPIVMTLSHYKIHKKVINRVLGDISKQLCDLQRLK
jgi:hypothetical protein